MVRFSKYVVMLIFLVRVIAIGYNQVCSQTLSYCLFVWIFLPIQVDGFECR